MTDQSKKVVLPVFLLRRLEAFRIAKGDETSYLLRDKIQGKTYDLDAWQFFILEVLPGYDTVEKLQRVFQDRFDRTITKQELDLLFAEIADQGLFAENAAEHPLLMPFTRKTYEVVEGGKAQPKSFTATVAVSGGTPVPTAQAPAPAPAPGAAPKAATPAGAPAAEKPGQPKELPAGVQDALGMDWTTTEKIIPLFDPRPALKVLHPVLWPIRHVIYAVPLLALAALFITFSYSNLWIDDLLNLKAEVSLFEHLFFVFVTVHVVTTTTAAVVANAYKVSVDTLGVCLTLGFMPRWVLKMTGADRLTRKQTMWLHGSTLVARVIMFSLGSFLWFSTRDTASDAPKVGLLFMFSCALGLMFESGNPLIKANGYYLLSAFLGEPKLRGKAYAALINKMKGGVYKAADSNVLALYGLLSISYVVFVILLVGWMIAKYVLGDLALSGTGVLLTLGFAGWMLWRDYDGIRSFAETFERQVQFDRWRSRTLPVQAVEGEVAAKQASYWKRALLLCLVLLLFVPYPYEPSGSFSVFPVQKAELTTDTPGIVSQVFFDGGEYVKKGTPIAVLAHDDYVAKIKVLNAQIDEQKHVIANLKTLPKPEEIKVAEEQLEVAQSHVPFSRDKAARLEKLYPTGAITQEELETARRDYEVDKMQVVEKQAALALAKTGPTKEYIASEEAKLDSLVAERADYEGKIARSTLRMPFDGNILTLHLKDKINSYLVEGKPFAEVENTGFVTAQVQLVESDIQYVKIGQKVRGRPTSYFDDEFEGKVTTIDRNVTPKSFGNVVNVLATFENKDGRLKTGMTGTAKVGSVSMPVWKAFTQSVVRFIRLQVWSWIP
jgi:putative peptide zinc metalloprotease protein